MPSAVNGFSVAYTAAGGVILWSGIKGSSISDTFRSVLAGSTAPPVTQKIPAAPASGTPAAASSPGAAAGNTGASTASAAKNQATAKLLAAPFGWSTGQQWTDLVKLWNQESGWNAAAVNPSSGATGIPQLLPSAHAIPPGWSSPSVQIAWGLSYIASTYPGGPSGAWAHETQFGWY